jgi:predicted metalloprotease
MANTIENKWNVLSEQEKTQIGITLDDRYLVINPSMKKHWNKEYCQLSELKKKRLESFWD